MAQKQEIRHIISSVIPGSIAAELELVPGDELLRINGKKIQDVFDYHYLTNEERLVLLVRKTDGEEWELEIEKDYEEDLGIGFEESLMDHYRSCRNKCIFCFIDQMPPGMRETLYFKDDDARLSFLQGNYITLTNMSDEDVERVCFYKLSPINISVHTMNRELRCKMLNNRFAGEALDKLKRFRDAGIRMNAQIVLCKGINDGTELNDTLSELEKLLPQMQSVSVVPVGLTKFRQGLYPLEKFQPEDAKRVLAQVHAWQERLLMKHGTRMVYASDEWYLTAGLPVPPAGCYEGYPQIENGVGMVRSFMDEVKEALKEKEAGLSGREIFQQEISGQKIFQQEITQREITQRKIFQREKEISLVTGTLAASVMEEAAKWVTTDYPHIRIHIYPIINHFFGEDITVAGLITGADLMGQLKDKPLGEYLMLPSAMLRSGEDVLLDDFTVNEIQTTLQTRIRIVKSDGASFVDAIVEDMESQ